MKKELAKIYEPGKYEDDIYEKWEKSGFFDPDNLKLEKNAKAYTIALPPPNVTGTLHMGHAAMLAIEDILIRFHRMRGYRTLWVPGTDHAAIATQTKVEKIIKEEGTNRHELGREKFLDRVEKFAQDSHDTIVNQIKKMGASIDWSREAYTLDETRHKAVYSVFKMMYDDGLIYRGERIINWCPRCHSTLADDEVEYKEENAKLYWIKYGPFVLATARPETKLGDTAVAVHPDDKRYTDMVGKEYDIPGVLGKFRVKVVADKAVDIEFGSGAIKVTPAHSFVDNEIAERHGVGMRQIINEDGKMMENCGKYAGMTTREARKELVKDMEKMGLIDHIEEDYKHNIALCYRCDTPIEPIPSEQWFIDVNKPLRGSKQTTVNSKQKIDWNGKSIKDICLEVVKEGKIKIIPKRFEKNYYHWMENLRDWCISRQIWYGHRVPVWYRKEGAESRAQKLGQILDITFFAHGSTKANEENIVSDEDFGLTKLGIEQANRQKELIENNKFDVVITSDLKRAIQTVEIMFGSGNVKIIQDKRLREVMVGNDAEINDGEHITKAYDGGESYKDVEERVKEFLDEISNKYSGKKIAIISHRIPQLAIEVLSKNKKWEEVIKEDWRKRDGWQCGWDYEYAGKDNSEIYVGVKAPDDKINFVFIHGFYRTREVKDPLNWLNQKLARDDNFWELLPGYDKPDRKEQTEFVLKNAKINENTVVVTHSLGGVLAMKMIEENDLKIKKLVLVSSPMEIEKPELKDYNKDNEFDFEKIKSLVGEIVIFQATEDHVLSPEDLANLAKNLDSRLIKAEASASHFNEDESLEIFNELKKDVWVWDEDTLDTWFSSGMWTFSTLAHSPDEISIKDGKLVIDSEDFKNFHPTQVLETGYDILFFWVARMIIMTTYAVGDIPFKDVYLHGLVLDDKGKKMSKSKGNVINPLVMCKKYGTDATRLSLMIGSSPGNDMKLSEEKIAGFRNFSNKLWNVARFILQTTENRKQTIEIDEKKLTLSDKWILNKIDVLIKEVTEDIEGYRLSQAGEKLREFTWSDLADWYLEISKFEKNEEKNHVLTYVLTSLLKLWHPFIPFVTETIWSEMEHKDMLVVEKWPQSGSTASLAVEPLDDQDFETVKEVISAIRNARAENKIEPGKKVKAVIYAGKHTEMLNTQIDIIKGLRTGIGDLEISNKKKAPMLALQDRGPDSHVGTIYIVVGDIEIYLIGVVDEEKEKARLKSSIERLEQLIKMTESKLGDKNFVERAPAPIVEKEKARLEEFKKEIESLEKQIGGSSS